MSIKELGQAFEDLRRRIDEVRAPIDAMGRRAEEVAELVRQSSESLTAAVAATAQPVELPWRLPTRVLTSPVVYLPKPEGVIYIDLATGDYTPDELEQLGAVLMATAWLCRREQAEITEEVKP